MYGFSDPLISVAKDCIDLGLTGNPSDDTALGSHACPSIPKFLIKSPIFKEVLGGLIIQSGLQEDQTDEKMLPRLNVCIVY